MKTDPDYFLNWEDPKEPAIFYRVEVRQRKTGKWWAAWSYGAGSCGTVSVFQGPYPSRNAAGVNQRGFLKDALRTFSRDSECDRKRDKARAAKWLAALSRPLQLEFRFGP